MQQEAHSFTNKYSFSILICAAVRYKEKEEAETVADELKGHLMYLSIKSLA